MKTKILDIYRSRTVDKDKLGDWYKQRLDICNSCPKNTKNIDNLTLKQKFIKLANTKKDFCVECGCGVEYKTAIKSESCPLGKWQKINTNTRTNDFNISLDDFNDIGASLVDNNKEIVLDYGKVKYKTDSEVNIVLDHNNSLKVKRVLTSCGCTTPKLDKKENRTNLSVKYDTKIKGKANRKLEVLYAKENRQEILNITIKIEVI